MARPRSTHREDGKAAPAVPLLAVVTGPPATGKSTIAKEIARRTRLAFVSKDQFKERLYDTFGSGEDVEAKIEEAALSLLLDTVGRQLEAGVSLVAESNFEQSCTERFRRLCAEHPHRLVQIHCSKPPDELEEQFARRAVSGRRHPGHGDAPDRADEVRRDAVRGRWDPLELDGELLCVDVDDVDFDALAGRLLELAPS